VVNDGEAEDDEVQCALALEKVLRTGEIGETGVLGRIGLRSSDGLPVKLLQEASWELRESLEKLREAGLAVLEQTSDGESITLVAGRVCEVLVSGDGSVVWVNAPDGSCIGRFNKMGHVDVHRTAQEQASGKGECLDCSHGGEAKGQWRRFRESMKLHYGVEVQDDLIRM
jgi:hypothetical protein